MGHGEVRLPSWLMKMDISKGAKLTYNVLATCSRGREYTWPSQSYLARELSSSVRTVQRHLGELVQCGLIGKGREIVEGRIRRVYLFLSAHAKLGAAKNQRLNRHDKFLNCPVHAQKNLQADLHQYR
ncbi:hypothetical protein C4J81_00505 [Deltaproteobacteria bacterium Smac51]|nr:hypothetical protein C4J81_00505 [Deltaproteobacteria bacterium Smac51]